MVIMFMVSYINNNNNDCNNDKLITLQKARFLERCRSLRLRPH